MMFCFLNQTKQPRKMPYPTSIGVGEAQFPLIDIVVRRAISVHHDFVLYYI
jgi:hypothetical protein